MTLSEVLEPTVAERKAERLKEAGGKIVTLGIRTVREARSVRRVSEQTRSPKSNLTLVVETEGAR